MLLLAFNVFLKWIFSTFRKVIEQLSLNKAKANHICCNNNLFLLKYDLYSCSCPCHACPQIIQSTLIHVSAPAIEITSIIDWLISVWFYYVHSTVLCKYYVFSAKCRSILWTNKVTLITNKSCATGMCHTRNHSRISVISIHKGTDVIRFLWSWLRPMETVSKTKCRWTVRTVTTHDCQKCRWTCHLTLIYTARLGINSSVNLIKPICSHFLQLFYQS